MRSSSLPQPAMPAASFSSRVISTSSTPEALVVVPEPALQLVVALARRRSLLMTASSLIATFAFERSSRSPDIQFGPIQPVSRPNSSKPVKRSAWVMPTPCCELST